MSKFKFWVGQYKISIIFPVIGVCCPLLVASYFDGYTTIGCWLHSYDWPGIIFPSSPLLVILNFIVVYPLVN
jgi:hypothetical protein